MLSIEDAHLPKHKVHRIDIAENAVLVLLPDEFLQIGYHSIASCDGKGFRIPLHETVDFMGNGVSHAHSTRLLVVLGPVGPVGPSVWSSLDPESPESPEAFKFMCITCSTRQILPRPGGVHRELESQADLGVRWNMFILQLECDAVW